MKKLSLIISSFIIGMIINTSSFAVTAHHVTSPSGKVTLIAIDLSGNKQFGESAIREGTTSFLVVPAKDKQLGEPTAFQTQEGTKYVAETPKNLKTLDTNNDNKLTSEELNLGNLLIATSSPDGNIKVVALNAKDIIGIDLKNKGKNVSLQTKDGTKTIEGKLITTKTWKAINTSEPTTTQKPI